MKPICPTHGRRKKAIAIWKVIVCVAAIALPLIELARGEPPRLLIIGDSLAATVAKPPADRPTLTGWGQVFESFLREGASVRNEARSGASSTSFLVRGSWQKAIEGPAADYLLIQFGGNDIKPDERFTDPASTYPDMLRGYIGMARGLGMKPVLISNAATRTFDDKGRITTTLDAYVAAMEKVATKERVPFVNLHAASKALFERLGESGSAPLNASAEDPVHFSREGALAMAGLVAEGLKRTVPELGKFITIP